MCTVSAIANEAMVLVTMNRDERRHRLEGAMHHAEQLSYPTDQQASGTWCGINAQGVMLCLLNRYDAPVSTEPHIVSRGNIIPQALEHPSVDTASSFVSGLNHSNYNGFKLLILSRDGGVWHNWNRFEHTVSVIDNPHDLFASSSSLRSLDIPVEREARYRRWQLSRESSLSSGQSLAYPGKIPDIHLLDTDVPPNESIFMVRRDTHTKSICQLAVTNTEVSLNYWPAQTGWEQTKRELWSAPL